ncbi:hypothetical protein AUJ14_01630 [Candidatus Micrarchaeota archaeon CG1_02_55_22]|nr:MAG: hypothetical protein AUJ14_01630 [Candidatus Micrarchaeota archaeon CG1_02_55_22]
MSPWRLEDATPVIGELERQDDANGPSSITDENIARLQGDFATQLREHRTQVRWYRTAYRVMDEVGVWEPPEKIINNCKFLIIGWCFWLKR